MPAIILVGAQWGDEGKGKVTDLLAAKADDLRRFANSFEKIVIPELESAVGQCGNNPDFIPAFTQFLRNEGVSESALEWVGPIMALSQVSRSYP